MERSTNLPFNRIPRQSKLFLDYIKLSPEALKYYQAAPTMESLARCARETVRNGHCDRSRITSILRRQNENYGCDKATLNQIDELENRDCVAVLTGQQVGLFTGPLYTIYKALTAIRLAGELRKKGIRAVPIFWMDTEDHDLAEVTHQTALHPDSSLEIIDYRQILFEETPAGPVGAIRFPDQIRNAIEKCIRSFPDNPHRPVWQAQLESTYRSGAAFAQSFAELIFRILRGSGLVLFDPSDIEAKQLSSEVFRTAIQKEEEFRTALLRRSGELEENGFHAQVNVLENSTVLFFLENGRRLALEKRDSRFGLKNTDRAFGTDELLESAIQNPEKFSPNVLLRPIVQDHLFPTAVYVGGSSELAYFAQIQILYQEYGRPMPVIWPRDSFTLLEANVTAEMERLGISIEDCFEGREFLLQKAVRSSRMTASMNELESRLEQVLTEIKPELKAVDPPLEKAAETARRKILHNIQHLKNQLSRIEAAGSSIPADLLLNNCYPNQNLQERELSILHFLSRHGSSVLDAIRSAITTSSFDHRILRL